MRTAAAVLALGLLVGVPARANDSTAELAAGGLVFVKNPNVEMRSEQLFISPLEVRVTYHFFNTGSQDVTSLVAFPMPDITIASADSNIAIPTEDPQNFLGFSTKVNGQPVTPQIEQKVFAKGADQTALLQQLGIPLAPQFPATAAALDALPKEKWQQLIDLGLAAIVEYDDSGANAGPGPQAGPGSATQAGAGGETGSGVATPNTTAAGAAPGTPAGPAQTGAATGAQTGPALTGVPSGAQGAPAPTGAAAGAQAGSAPPTGAAAGSGMKQHLDPRWTLKTTYYWQQVFPAHQETVIEHRYEPSVGESVETLIGNPQFPNHPEYQQKYCMDADFLAAAAKAWQEASRTNSPQYAEERIDYVLSTGANWSGPIADFTLIVDKGDTNALLSLCATGIEKLSPTQYKLHLTNFTPKSDLAILILTKAPIQ